MISRSYKKILFAAGFSALASVAANAQTGANQVAPPPQQNTIAVAENYELDIAQKRITETDFARSTSVEFAGENRAANVFVQIGVGVRAERINVSLRGVTGRVTFRGSLDALRARIERTANINSRISP